MAGVERSAEGRRSAAQVYCCIADFESQTVRTRLRLGLESHDTGARVRNPQSNRPERKPEKSKASQKSSGFGIDEI